MRNFFSIPDIFLNTEGFSFETFRYVETKRQNSFYGNSWYTPTVLSVTFFDTRSFLKHRRVFQQIFGSVRQKTFDWNREYSSSPHLSINFFDTAFFMKHKMFPLRCFSILWDNNFSTERFDVPCFLSSKLFDARSFLKHRTEHVQSFSALWDKRFPTERIDLPFLCKRCFDTRNYLKHGRGPLRNISELWDKIFEKKSWYTPSSFIH